MVESSPILDNISQQLNNKHDENVSVQTEQEIEENLSDSEPFLGFDINDTNLGNCSTVKYDDFAPKYGFVEYEKVSKLFHSKRKK